MKSKVKTSTIIIFVLITLLGLIRATYDFVYKKDGMHSDEIWSYGLANSYYEPYIYMDEDATVMQNFNEWIPSDVLKDYITVQEDQKFSYGAVIYNMSNDLHPPLYFMVLHTICSFFPDTYSPWYGFIINMFSFIIMMIFIFRLAKLMTNSDFFTLAFCAYWAFCSGVLNMMMFIRMYTMSTTIFVAFMYFTFRLMKTGKIAKNVPWLALTVFLGAMTHHFFLVAAGLLTVFVSIYYLIRKRIKLLLVNGFSLLGAVGLSVAAFPATIHHLLYDAPKASVQPFVFSVKACLRFMGGELFGVLISPYKTQFWDYIMVAVILLLAIFVPILILLKKNDWVKANIFGFPKKVYNYFKTHSKTALAFSATLLLSTLGVAMVVARIVSVLSMSVHTDRYLFVIYPAFALAVAYLVYSFINIFKKKKWIGKTVLCIILAAFVAVSNFRVGCNYYFTSSDDDIELSKVTENSNVVLALTRAWTITCFTDSLMNADNVFVTDFDRCQFVQEEIETTPSNSPVYLAICTDNLYDDYVKPETVEMDDLEYAMYGHDKKTFMNYFSSLSIAEKFDYIGEDHIFGETVRIYKLRD